MSFKEECLSWNNVGATKIIIFLIIIIALNYYIFYKNYYNTTNIRGDAGPFDICLVECDNPVWRNISSTLRDPNYSLGIDVDHRKCMFTGWELSHVILHGLLGYFFNVYISVSLSILFELYEHYVYDCASVLDLFWNTSGLLVGISIRYAQHKPLF